jgi:cytochrome c biogenesis protein CcmG/thiol:disulfide interchange protein DsbE
VARGRLLVVVGVAVVVAFIIGATVWSVSSSDDGSSGTAKGAPRGCATTVTGGGAARGDHAPDFTLPGLDRGCVKLAALAGRPVVVNFWASWCNPCRREFPLLRDAAHAHAGDDLAVVGITYRDIATDARNFASDQGADWALAFDDGQRVAKAYGVDAVPQTFFIGRDGQISGRTFGPLTKAELSKELAKITRR